MLKSELEKYETYSKRVVSGSTAKIEEEAAQ
jgi:hypothetical protein